MNASEQKQLRFGYIGLGDIGYPMAERIALQKIPLTVWNRTISKAGPLTELGVTIAPSPAALAERCNVVALCLSGIAAAEETLFGAEGIANVPGEGKVIVDHSTLSPEATRSLAGKLKSKAGWDWLDVPVSGGPAGARAGTLAAMAGGDERLIERVRPLLENYTGRLTHLGDIGAGQTAKACNQMIGFSAFAAIAEALGVAERNGLALDRFLEAITGGFADSTVLQEYIRCRETGEFGGIAWLVEIYRAYLRGEDQPQLRGKLGNLIKDLGVMRAVSESVSLPTPGTTAIRDAFKKIARP